MAKKKSLGVMNAGYPGEIYKKIPCRIGYNYARLQVNGTLLPCCVSNMPLGSLHQKSFSEIWYSDAYAAFREKTAVIHKERFYVKDPDWAFCQQCSHVDINLRSEKEAQKKS